MPRHAHHLPTAPLTLLLLVGAAAPRAVAGDAAIDFAPPQPVAAAGGEPGDVVFGDFDGDGHLDLVTITEHPYGLTLRHGDGAGGFRPAIFRTPMPPQFIESSSTRQRLAVADLDADGNLDVLVTVLVEPTGDHAIVRFEHEDGAFVIRAGGFVVTDAAECIELADLNGDGALDVVYGMFHWERSCAARLGNGAGGFGPAIPLLDADWTSDVALADVDGDGDVDVLASKEVGAPPENPGVPSSLVLVENLGGGSFAPAVPLPHLTPASAPVYTLLAADLDDDGAVDLVQASPGAASVLAGDGQGGFAEVQSLLHVGPAATLADLDADGRPDLVLWATGATLTVRPGLGDGTFGEPSDIDGSCGSWVMAADLDGDGDGDIVTLPPAPGGGEVPPTEITVFESRSIVRPAIAVEPPAATLASIGDALTLSIGVAPGTPEAMVRWERNGAKLSGAIGPTLDIASVDAADSGSYEAIVTHDGLDARSRPAIVAIAAPACAGDANGDGIVDLADLNAVLFRFGDACD